MAALDELIRLPAQRQMKSERVIALAWRAHNLKSVVN
jgi:hypothetical protein